MKYIVIKSESGMPAAILFNEIIQHKAVADGLKVLSAGFCNAAGEVWGRSDSLDVGSQPGDAKHVRMALYFNFNEKPLTANASPVN